MQSILKELQNFVKFAAKELSLSKLPKIHFVASENDTAFIHGKNSDLSIAGASYSADIAQDMGRDVQKIIGSRSSW